MEDVGFRVKFGDVVEQVQGVKEELSCGRKKGCKLIYKLPSPVKVEMEKVPGSENEFFKLISSSELIADDSKYEIAYFEQGDTVLNKELCKKLGVSVGDQIVFRDISLPVATEITLLPSDDRPARPPIPKIITPGLTLMNIIEEPHPLYGGVFSDNLTWRITKIAGTSPTGFYKFSRFSTKVIYDKPQPSSLPKNLYKKFSPKGHFSSLPELNNAVKSLSKLFRLHSIVFINSQRNCGKRAGVFKAGWKIGFKVIETSMCNLSTLKSFESVLKSQPEFSILHIRQFAEGVSSMTSGQSDVIYKIRDLLSEYLQRSSQCCVVLSNSINSQLPGPIRNLCVEVLLPPPGPGSRFFIFNFFLSYKFNPEQLVQHSSGKSIEDLANLCTQSTNEPDLVKSFKLTSTGIPNVKWEDVGGLQLAKQEIIDTIQLPLTHPEYFKLRPRSGLLLYGPPGTGKTLLAKAIATECSLHFIPVKGPELLNMYIGESEKNVRELFEKARALQPSVLFFDELDSLAPKRGQGSDLGVMDRIVSQLLTEIDSLQYSNKLFIIGATNRPDLLDPALLRPGRFDKMIFLGVAEDFDSKLKVFEAQTYKFNLQGVDLKEVVRKCEGLYSGADIYAVCAQALADAYKEKVKMLEEELNEVNENEFYGGSIGFDEFVQGDKGKVVVRQEHLERALEKVKPTISEKDLEKYRFFGK